MVSVGKYMVIVPDMDYGSIIYTIYTYTTYTNHPLRSQLSLVGTGNPKEPFEKQSRFTSLFGKNPMIL